MEIKRTQLSRDCVSDFVLDLWLSGDVSAQKSSDLQKHVDACSRCADRVAEIRGFQQAAKPFELSLPKGHAVVTPHGNVRPLRRFASVTFVGLAAAALLLLTVSLSSFKSLPHFDGRTKGQKTRVAFFIKHGIDVRRGVQGDTVAPGDALQLVVTFEVPQYVAVVGIDATRRVQIYYPYQTNAERVLNGHEVPLNKSIVFDDVLGRERLFVVSCDRPFTTQSIIHSIPVDTLSAPDIAGCDVESIYVEKK